MSDTSKVGSVDLDSFVSAYIECALWSSTDESDESDESGGEPMDKNYDASDLAPETLARMRKDCDDFLMLRGVERALTYAGDLKSLGSWTPRGTDDLMAAAGHAFWLTRNRSGAGFTDGDWPMGSEVALDSAAKGFGEFNLYIGDDGRIYGC